MKRKTKFERIFHFISAVWATITAINPIIFYRNISANCTLVIERKSMFSLITHHLQPIMATYLDDYIAHEENSWTAAQKCIAIFFVAVILPFL